MPFLLGFIQVFVLGSVRSCNQTEIMIRIPATDSPAESSRPSSTLAGRGRLLVFGKNLKKLPVARGKLPLPNKYRSNAEVTFV